jgi:hypothetical protein
MIELEEMTITPRPSAAYAQRLLVMQGLAIFFPVQSSTDSREPNAETIMVLR